MKKTLKGFLHFSAYPWNYGELVLRHRDYTGDTTMCEILIKEIAVEIDIPDDFDPRPQQIKALEEKQKQAAAAFQTMNTEIMRQISQLQAICFDMPEVVNASS